MCGGNFSYWSDTLQKCSAQVFAEVASGIEQDQIQKAVENGFVEGVYLRLLSNGSRPEGGIS